MSNPEVFDNVFAAISRFAEIRFGLPWKTVYGYCHDSWSAAVELDAEPLLYKDSNGDIRELENTIIDRQGVNNGVAEYVVKLHNENLQRGVIR